MVLERKKSDISTYTNMLRKMRYTLEYWTLYIVEQLRKLIDHSTHTCTRLYTIIQRTHTIHREFQIQ